MKININIETGYSENYKNLIPFQGELKSYKKKKGKKGKDALRNSIITEGIIYPTFVWVDDDVKYIWDGHGRQEIYESLEGDGYEMPDLPVVYLLAKNSADAKIKLLKKEQDYGRRVNKKGLAEFLDGESIIIDDMCGLNLPGIGELDISFLENIMDDGKVTPGPKKENNSCDTEPDKPLATSNVKHGDIFELGRHRVMCGDSTKINEVEKLMNGRKADMVFTDPPYGVNFKSNWTKKFEVLKNDDVILNFIPSLEFISKENTPWFIWTSHQVYPGWRAIFDKYYKSTIIWHKGGGGMGDLEGDYALEYEMALFCVKGHPRFINNRPSAVWKIGQDAKSKYIHPTQKPVMLSVHAMSHFLGKGKIVVDFFGGSGSTLIGCEDTLRICYLMELDPQYIDVIIDRWERHTGQKAVKL